MTKISRDDKIRIQTLRHQGLDAKAIRSAYLEKQWSLRALNRHCRQIDATGSEVEKTFQYMRSPMQNLSNSLVFQYFKIKFGNNTSNYLLYKQ